MTFPAQEVMELLIHLGSGNTAAGVDGHVVVYVEARAGVRPTKYSTDALDALEERGWIELAADQNGRATAKLTDKGRYAVERWWFKHTGKRVDARSMRPAGRPVEMLTTSQLW